MNAHGVEFLIVGAYALAFHGVPRFTGDLELLGFTIPYTPNGEEKPYFPDFIAQMDCGSVRLQPDLLNMIVEVTGEARKDKAAKVTTARTLWVPAVNNHGGFERWAFVEVADQWDAQRTIREACRRCG